MRCRSRRRTCSACRNVGVQGREGHRASSGGPGRGRGCKKECKGLPSKGLKSSLRDRQSDCCIQETGRSWRCRRLPPWPSVRLFQRSSIQHDETPKPYALHNPSDAPSSMFFDMELGNIATRNACPGLHEGFGARLGLDTDWGRSSRATTASKHPALQQTSLSLKTANIII